MRVRLKNISLPATSDFDAVRIYRNLSSNAQTFYRVTTLSGGETSYIDNASDTSIEVVGNEINLEGAAINLGLALNDCKVKPSSSTRIVVAETDGLVIGLTVDSAIEVLQVGAASLEDPPALATHAGYDAARAVVRRPDSEPIVVLSLEFLLESVYRSVLTTREDAA